MAINDQPAVTPKTADVLAALGQPRLGPYRQTFKPTSDDELLGVYQWAQAISTSLHPLLGLSEVVLRNAIHASLSRQCSNKSSESCAWYDRAVPNSIVLRGKSLAKVEELLCEGSPPIRKSVQPAPDLVVSRLSFGFWPNVLEELSNRNAPRTFSDVFPFHPHSKPAHWSVEQNKQTVVMRLKRLQDLRNRVCHFEAIWKPHWLGAQSAHWSHGVLGLKNLHADMVEMLGWCSQDAAMHYRASFGCNWFTQLCTTNAVFGFMKDAGKASFMPSFSAPAAASPAGQAPAP